MRKLGLLFVAGFVTGLAGCGVAPDAARLAQQESTLLAADPGDDAAVRQALLAQADAWTSLSALLEKKQLGGAPVGEDFRAVVQEVCQLTARQRALIEAGQDDPATDRAVLGHLKNMWDSTQHYLAN